MSRQLRAAGEDIGLVGLFDGFSPYTPKLSASDPDAASARVLATIARNLSIFSGQHLTITDSDLAGLSAEERMAYFLAEAKSRNVFPPDLSMADVRAFLDASDRHVRAFWSYVPAVVARSGCCSAPRIRSSGRLRRRRSWRSGPSSAGRDSRRSRSSCTGCRAIT
jgi:hypothetical protein